MYGEYKTAVAIDRLQWNQCLIEDKQGTNITLLTQTVPIPKTRTRTRGNPYP